MDYIAPCMHTNDHILANTVNINVLLLSVSTVSHYPRGHHASTSSQPPFPSPNGATQQNAKK